ncbi:hypothetical protein OEA41_001855 [Lepraria neglecta]|uniref:Uncharacterized protein n=1 Tax=Lepraria neglecta TaxID=209136 RepID=A0AAD9ZAU3_9LECA|nr:hypothetical protein OEA41_001855 [Lepraria neglecta]
MVVDSFGKLPAELRVMVMSHAPDLKTLLNISAAHPDLAPELERTSEVLMPAVISRYMPTELEQLVNAILTVRANPSTADAEPLFPGRRVKFYGVQADWSTKALLNLKLLVDIQSAIDFFVQGFVRKQCYPDKGKYSQPPTRTELECIHRALWRFELCCELYRSPTSNGGFIEYGRLSSTRLSILSKVEIYDKVNTLVAQISAMITPVQTPQAHKKLTINSKPGLILAIPIEIIPSSHISPTIDCIHVSIACIEGVTVPAYNIRDIITAVRQASRVHRPNIVRPQSDTVPISTSIQHIGTLIQRQANLLRPNTAQIIPIQQLACASFQLIDDSSSANISNILRANNGTDSITATR